MKQIFFATILSVALTIFYSCGESKNSGDADSISKNESDIKSSSKTDSPKNETVEEQVNAIRKIFQEIESAGKSLTVEKRDYRNPNPEMYYDMSNYTAYSKNNELKKLLEEGGEEGYLFETTYYYDGGKLIFTYSCSTFMDILYRESRVYFNDGKIIRAWLREKPQDDEKTDLSKLENKDDPDFKKDTAEFTKIQLASEKSAQERFASAK